MQAEEVPVGGKIGPLVVDVEGALSFGTDRFEVDFPRRGTGGRLLLVRAGRPHAVVSLGSHAEEIERLADAKTPTLSWAEPVDDHIALIELRVFDAEMVTGRQVIHVPDQIASQLESQLGITTIDDERLLDEFALVDTGNGGRFVVASGITTGDMWLVGRSCRLRIDTTVGLMATSLDTSPKVTARELVRLCRGSLSFSSETPGSSPILSSLATTTAPIFDLWEKYNVLELAAAQERAAEIGEARHGKPEYRDDLIVLPIRAAEDQGFLRELGRERSDRVEVEIVPVSIGFHSDGPIPDRLTGTVEFVDVVGKTITVRPRQNQSGIVTSDGLVRPHLGGATVQSARRQAVFERLRLGDHPISALGPILREQRPPTTPRPKQHTAVTEAVKRVIPGTLTPAQQRAIDVAINTPDIALIQGPPGTGKSQVIAAIQQRLAEISPAGTARLILLTSVQHDAVDLVAARTNIFGLPPRRIAKRGNEIENPIDKWRKERIAALQRYKSKNERSALSRWLGDLINVYRETPYTSAAAADLLEEVIDRCGGEIEADLRIRMEERSASLRPQRNRSRLAADLRAVRGLRVTSGGHEDDGPQRAERLLRRNIPDIVDGDSRITQTLEALSTGANIALTEVAVIRDGLLDKLLRAETIGGAALADQQTQSLLAEALVQVMGSRDRPITPEEAVDLFILDLELDAFGVENAIGSYTAVWASTCQGSASLFVGDLAANRTALPFPTVIVDEAARANPLDLLIPMVQAEERIILVGDHRQLPQLIDTNLRRQLADHHHNFDTALLDESLFERLFRHLEQLEVETGIPRAVTLDVQFRMHPTLGEFVSRVFYEPYNEGFSSGRPSTDFEHTLDRFEGKVAAWIDVPAREGPPTRRGTSLFRTAEARVVAETAAEILVQAPDLSVGIITFYAAQKEQILEELLEFGLTEHTENGIEVSELYRVFENQTGQREERLRVGTVDSFQGKEFDVVLLSMVRVGSSSASSDATDVFGFLSSENRTCVALSRQRRLLIVVGDRRIVEHPQAGSIRGLIELAELCGDPL